MTTKELQKYLGAVFDLEKERYMQNCLHDELQNRIANLGIAYVYNKPYTPENNSKLDGGTIGSGIGVGFIIGVIVTLVVKFFSGDLFGFFGDFFGYLGDLIIGGIIGSVIVGIIFAIIAYSDFNKQNKEYEYEFHRYTQRLQEYEHNCAADTKRVKRELKEAAYLKEEKNTLEEQMNRTVNLLQDLYGKGIIFEKYWWNIVAIASFIEYLNSGRCKALTGHEGAYNIYEMEIRLNHIVGQLDEVIRRLDQIQHNQYMIYNAIQESNQKLNSIYSKCVDIASGLGRIEVQNKSLSESIKIFQENSELTLYFAEQNNKELQYRNQFLK